MRGLSLAKVFFKLGRNQILALSIILLGWLHVLIYALVMPPWGLLDESQHFHYIQVISEEHRLPIMWQDHLSKEVLDSIFAVKRYVTLGASAMPSQDELIQSGHFDGYSYEAYHPPLYYALLAPVYAFGPTDVLKKLFILRLVSATLSCLTLGIIWKSTRILWSDQPGIAVVATLFVALHPERTVSVAQLNNDTLLEIMCACAFGWLALAMVQGLRWRLALAVTLTLGLAVLTKLSALIIVPALILGWIIAGRSQHRPWPLILKQVGVILAGVAACSFPIVARNLILYHEPTGLGTFVAHIPPLVTGSWDELLVVGMIDLWRNSWAILWDGAQVVSKPSAALLHLALVLETGGLGWMVIRAWSRRDNEALTPLRRGVIVTSCAALVLVSLATLFSYMRGLIPVVQGRFLLPALVPTAWLIGFSLWLVGARWRGLMATLLFLLEITLGLSILFFHALPKFYAPRYTGFLGYWSQTEYLFSPAGLFWDKPNLVNIWTVGLTLLAFCGCAIILGILIIKQFGSPLHIDQLRTLMSFFKAQALAPNIAPKNTAATLNIRWIARLRQVALDPLFWTATVLLLGYLGWVSFYPTNIFWSLDEGGKFVHLQSIIASGNPGTPLLYPGRYLDQNLRFVPLHFWSRQNDQVYSWWPVGFQLITVPFYLLFGWFGLYLLPALAGAVSALFSGLLVRHFQPQRHWLAVSAAIITGLATPVAFYSTLFWEHTLSVACFMGGLLLILHAWQTGSARWMVIAGVPLALATYLRTDMAAMVAGIGLVLFFLYWRWSILLGASYIFTCLVWVLVNWLLMGHFLASYWATDTTTTSLSTAPLFLGFQDAGIWFIPYTLFNAPRVIAFSLGPGLLALATLLTVIVLVTPWSGHWRWLLLMSYAGLSCICAWVLLQPDGYRSVHGFILIAPHVLFVACLYRSRSGRPGSPLPALLLGMTVTYIVSYLVRGWVAAGGLQWGPRYWLVFYPLFVAASLIGLSATWPSLSRVMQLSVLMLYSLAVLIGFGYQVRGMYAALETKRYYHQSEQTIRQLKTETIVTTCTWLSLVMPDLYWTGSLYTITTEKSFEDWVAEARRVGVHSVCRVEMDLCQLALLNDIATQRKTNPGGIQTQCFSE